MTPEEWRDKKIIIWGSGREGQAAAAFIQRHDPHAAIVFIDENKIDHIPRTANTLPAPILRHPTEIADALSHADIIVKSPGVSLYHSSIIAAQARGVTITSLLNLWFASEKTPYTISVTGTKGKSTTASLIAHALQKCGKRAGVVGNIGLPITAAGAEEWDVAVIEISSYQAADFNGKCDIGVITSLYPEHLDWHRDLATYYRDKLNLLHHARTSIANTQIKSVLAEFHLNVPKMIWSNDPNTIHIQDKILYDDDQPLGTPQNPYLCSAHNLENVATAITALRQIGIDPITAIKAMTDFVGLPHRQFELGARNNILYVDDSISTTPQSAIAALENYRARPVVIILGGYDRGIDYAPLIDYLRTHPIAAAICLGASGARIHEQLARQPTVLSFYVPDLPAAVAQAQAIVPANGVILLSPAAPSYDQYKDFIARGEHFASLCGFPVKSQAD